MKQNYRYKKIPLKKGGYLLLPIIPIELEYKGDGIRYEALIDSGADMNLFPWEIADYFGFKKKDSKDKTSIFGISGEAVEAYLFDVIIVVGGSWRHASPCWFTDKLSETQYGFLGQKGFFSQYRVEFHYAKGKISIRDK